MARKILILCYDFGDKMSPNSRRWIEIATNWASKGIEVFVVTSVQDFEKKKNVNIYPTYFAFSNRVKRPIVNYSKSHTLIFSYFNFFISFIKKVIFFIHDYSWKKLYWPDFAILWSFFSLNQVSKIIKSENIDKCIIVSRPFSTSLIPYFLSYKFKNLEWVIDYIDPFYNSKSAVNNYFLYNKVNKKFEFKILDKAKSIFVLNERIRDNLINSHQIDFNKFVIVPNIFVKSSIPNIQNTISDKKNCITITFIGSLNGNFRSPKETLLLFSEIFKTNNNIKVFFYGEILFCEQIFKDYADLINKNIFLMGVIDRDSAMKIMSNSDFLLNIGNDNDLQEPSKLMDYIYLSKPIINIAKIDNDASFDLLNSYNQSITLVINEHTNLIKPKVNSLISFISNTPRLNNIFRENILKQRSTDNISNLLIERIKI